MTTPEQCRAARTHWVANDAEHRCQVCGQPNPIPHFGCRELGHRVTMDSILVSVDMASSREPTITCVCVRCGKRAQFVPPPESYQWER